MNIQQPAMQPNVDMAQYGAKPVTNDASTSSAQMFSDLASPASNRNGVEGHGNKFGTQEMAGARYAERMEGAQGRPSADRAGGDDVDVGEVMEMLSQILDILLAVVGDGEGGSEAASGDATSKPPMAEPLTTAPATATDPSTAATAAPSAPTAAPQSKSEMTDASNGAEASTSVDPSWNSGESTDSSAIGDSELMQIIQQIMQMIMGFLAKQDGAGAPPAPTTGQADTTQATDPLAAMFGG